MKVHRYAHVKPKMQSLRIYTCMLLHLNKVNNVLAQDIAEEM